MKNKKLVIMLIAISILVFACKQPQKSKKPMQKKEELTSVFVKKLKPEMINDYIKISGRLESTNKVDYISEVSGNIDEIFVELGDYVTVGDSIGRLKENDFSFRLRQSEASFNAAKLNFEIAVKSKDTSEKLYQQKSISNTEYNQSLSSWNNAKSGFEMAKANLESAQRNSRNAIFTAPISGYISYLPVSNGQHINMGQQVYRIVNLKKLKIRSAVSETDIIDLKKNDSATIYYDKLDLTLKGYVNGIGKDLIPNKNLYPIEITVKNTGNKLLPGMVVEAKIKTIAYENLIIIPIDSIQKKYDINYVYCVSKDKTAIEKKIEILKVIDNNVLIKSGLEFGDSVIISGTEDLYDGLKLKVQTN